MPTSSTSPAQPERPIPDPTRAPDPVRVPDKQPRTDPIEAPGRRGMEQEPDRSKAYGPGGAPLESGTPVQPELEQQDG